MEFSNLEVSKFGLWQYFGIFLLVGRQYFGTNHNSIRFSYVNISICYITQPRGKNNIENRKTKFCYLKIPFTVPIEYGPIWIYGDQQNLQRNLQHIHYQPKKGPWWRSATCSFTNLGASINYVCRRGGRGETKFLCFFISLCSKLAYGGRRGVKNG